MKRKKRLPKARRKSKLRNFSCKNTYDIPSGLKEDIYEKKTDGNFVIDSDAYDNSDGMC